MDDREGAAVIPAWLVNTLAAVGAVTVGFAVSAFTVGVVRGIREGRRWRTMDVPHVVHVPPSDEVVWEARTRRPGVIPDDWRRP